MITMRMKKGIIKKIVTLGLAVVTTLSMGTIASAADVTINGPKNGHTYEVYQIFTGDVDASNKLSNAKYGTVAKLPSGKNVGDAVPSETLNNLAGVASASSDRAKLEEILKYVDESKLDGTTDNLAATITNDNFTATVPSGYYLIKDKENSILDNNKAEAYTLYLVAVAGNTITIEPKSDVPTVEKQVKEDSTDAWGKVADAELKQEVEFKLTGTLPTDYANYEYYTYEFEDTFTGMDFDSTSVNVTIDSEDGTDITSAFTVDTSASGKVTITCTNLKANAATTGLTKDNKIIVTYKASLNDAAVIGNPGNPNTVDLVYSNNPNVKADGTKNTTDKTPEDKVVVFTYELDVNKYDSNTDAKLADAEFVLINSAGKYAKLDANNRITEWVDSYEGVTECVLTSSATETIKIIGLDAKDEYKLKEIKAPAGGYQQITKDITIKIDSTITDAAITAITATVDTPASLDVDSTDYTNGKVTVKVPNTKESNLPTTGGMGTKMFYIGGAVLMAVAAIALVVKKKLNRI
ncbi:MAG: isopeptide-forming domain-containing fimbrial protein [Eubacteriales bacterium]|nr:isopeptide-forming domain-containing fimbrial protein [Eubacteriales bacterium]